MKRIGSLLSRVLPLAVAFVAVSLSAQVIRTVTVTFASEGDREVWIGPTASPGDYVKPQAAQGTGITLDVPEKIEGMSVFVHNKKTGNVATKSLTEIAKTGGWLVEQKDESLVRQMEIIVSYDAKPVATALVKAKAGSQTRQALLAPPDKGHAFLYNLPPGQVQVTVEYKTGTGPNTSSPQTFEAKLNAGKPLPKTIAITEPVETVDESTPSNSTPTKGDVKTGNEVKSASAPDPGPNPGVSFLNLLLGIAVIGAICYGIYTYVKKNPQQFEDTLKKAGLGAQDPAVDDVPPPPAAPQPLKPIVLDDATPTMAAQPIAAPTVAVQTPRLVKADGSVILLNEGSNVVGREDGLQVSLVGESSVSRHHATLTKSGDEVRLSDAGSTNGTFVNGQKLTGEHPLQPGDNVQFGAVAFRYEV